ncbi:MAG: sulfatase [Anaerolineae bacterium]
MSQQKPDVLLIILDTQRRDRLSVYGHHQNTSPELDAFSTGATLFERAVAPAQWTVPAHTSMFTGLYPTTHLVTQANTQLSGSYPTLAEILQVEGYYTVGFCNNPLVGVLNNGLQRGFTDFYNYAGAAPNRPLDVRRHGMRRMLSRRWRRFAQTVSQRFAHSDWLFRVSLHPALTPLWTRYINYKGHTANSITDLIETLRQRRNGEDHHARQPIFAFLNLMGTHLPYRPPQDFLPRSALSKDAYRFMSRFNADAARWASPVESPLSAEEQHIIDSYYDAEIMHQDVHLGRLLRYLKDSGALENTLVIIAADHGEGHGDHDFFGHSFVVYQELVHVPLIIHYPAHFPVGKRVGTNVSTRRIFHTILQAAGIKPPLDEADPNGNIDQLTLLRATNCQPDSEGGMAFSEAVPPMTMVNTIRHRNPALIDRMNLLQVRRGVYLGDHKLAMVGDHVEGLFDVDADPAETQNIAAQHAPLVTELQGKINAFVQDAAAHRADGSVIETVSDDVVDNLRALGYIE